MQVMVSLRLKQKEADFVRAVAEGMNPSNAADEAGYSKCMARHLMARPHVRAAMVKARDALNTAIERGEKAASDA